MTWDDLIAKLAEWEHNPEELAEYDLIPPTREAIMAARAWANIHPRRKRPPDRAVRDGDGGIVFDYLSTPTGSRSLEFDHNGNGTWLGKMQ